MTYIIGMSPGTVYQGTDVLSGKCPAAGTRGTTGDGREYVFCLVAASQNLVDGSLVTIDPTTFTATVAAAGPPAPASGNVLGVARATATASASAYIWVQRYGVGSVLATSSTDKNIVLTMAAAAGQVDDAIATASGVIEGLILTATAGAGGITACFLSYPRFAEPGMPG